MINVLKMIYLEWPEKSPMVGGWLGPNIWHIMRTGAKMEAPSPQMTALGNRHELKGAGGRWRSP